MNHKLILIMTLYLYHNANSFPSNNEENSFAVLRKNLLKYENFTYSDDSEVKATEEMGDYTATAIVTTTATNAATTTATASTTTTTFTIPTTATASTTTPTVITSTAVTAPTTTSTTVTAPTTTSTTTTPTTNNKNKPTTTTNNNDNNSSIDDFLIPFRLGMFLLTNRNLINQSDDIANASDIKKDENVNSGNIFNNIPSALSNYKVNNEALKGTFDANKFFKSFTNLSSIFYNMLFGGRSLFNAEKSSDQNSSKLIKAVFLSYSVFNDSPIGENNIKEESHEREGGIYVFDPNTEKTDVNDSENVSDIHDYHSLHDHLNRSESDHGGFEDYRYTTPNYNNKFQEMVGNQKRGHNYDSKQSTGILNVLVTSTDKAVNLEEKEKNKIKISYTTIKMMNDTNGDVAELIENKRRTDKADNETKMTDKDHVDNFLKIMSQNFINLAIYSEGETNDTNNETVFSKESLPEEKLPVEIINNKKRKKTPSTPPTKEKLNVSKRKKDKDNEDMFETGYINRNDSLFLIKAPKRSINLLKDTNDNSLLKESKNSRTALQGNLKKKKRKEEKHENDSHSNFKYNSSIKIDSYGLKQNVDNIAKHNLETDDKITLIGYDDIDVKEGVINLDSDETTNTSGEKSLAGNDFFIYDNIANGKNNDFSKDYDKNIGYKNYAEVKIPTVIEETPSEDIGKIKIWKRELNNESHERKTRENVKEIQAQIKDEIENLMPLLELLAKNKLYTNVDGTDKDKNKANNGQVPYVDITGNDEGNEKNSLRNRKEPAEINDWIPTDQMEERNKKNKEIENSFDNVFEIYNQYGSEN
ncbi:UNVERIFIED_CONTAM: hypothetical protein RMT77_015973 [Armadillidium vulgare]